MNPLSEKLEFLLDSERVGIADWRPFARELYLSTGSFRLLRRPARENPEAPVDYQEVYSWLHPEDLAEARTCVAQQLKDSARDAFQVEIRVRNFEGDYRHLCCIGRVAERDLERRPTRIAGYIVDITDQKNYERYKTLINAAPVGIVVTSRSDPLRVLYMNDFMARLLAEFDDQGRPDRGSLRQHSLLPFVHPEFHRSRPEYFALIQSASDDLDGRHQVGQLRTKSGETIEARITTALDIWEGQKAIYFFVEDITQSVREKAQLAERNDELKRLTYTVSHDLKAPMITINTYLQFLIDEARERNTKRFNEDLERVVRAAGKTEQLLDGLLQLSRIGRREVRTEPIRLEKEVKRVVELLQPSIAERDVEVVIKELPTVKANRTRVVQLYQNLIQNAVKFMGDQRKPRVVIGSVQIDGETRLYVKDNGVGIPEAYRQSIFGVFNKIDPKSEGCGIGLSLVGRIVESYGGRIWVESNKKKGVTFWFTLPTKADGKEGPTQIEEKDDSD
jgi:signal transduction histidine kinase